MSRHRVRGVYRYVRLAVALPLCNFLACLMFVTLREPTPAWHLQEIESERQRGGFLIDDSSWGTLACRTLYAWSTFHGGEEIGVAALEVVNLPSLVLTAIGGVFGDDFGMARLTTACRWSWLLGGVFIGLASAQWWLVGSALDRGRRPIKVHPAVLAYLIAPLGTLPTSGALLLYFAIDGEPLRGTTFMTFAVTVAYVIGLPLLPVWWIFEKLGWQGWRYYVPTGVCVGVLMSVWVGIDEEWEWPILFVGTGLACAIVFSIVRAYGRRFRSRTG